MLSITLACQDSDNWFCAFYCRLCTLVNFVERTQVRHYKSWTIGKHFEAIIAVAAQKPEVSSVTYV